MCWCGGIPEAMVASPAVKVFVCNLMTQANESLGLTAADHIRAIYNHARHRIFDYALVNRTPVSDAMKARYALEGASQIVCDTEAIETLGVRVICGDYLDVEAGVARHATDRVAHDLLALALGAPTGASRAPCLRASHDEQPVEAAPVKMANRNQGN